MEQTQNNEEEQTQNGLFNDAFSLDVGTSMENPFDFDMKDVIDMDNLI